MKESMPNVSTEITRTHQGEILPKEQPLVCPTCERNFEKLTDFPRLCVISVSHIVTPGNVPAEILDDHTKISVVPQDVLEYFRKHPDEDRLVHPDGYIYTRPWLETREYKKILERNPDHFRNIRIIEGDLYIREYNWAPTFRSMLLEGSPLSDYLKTLESLEGQEVRTEDVFPKWERGDIPKDLPSHLSDVHREILIRNTIRNRTPMYIIPGYESFSVELRDTDLISPEGSAYLSIEARRRALLSKDPPNKVGIERYKGWGLVEIGIWHEKGLKKTRLLVLGAIKYAGRINKGSHRTEA